MWIALGAAGLALAGGATVAASRLTGENISLSTQTLDDVGRLAPATTTATTSTSTSTTARRSPRRAARRRPKTTAAAPPPVVSPPPVAPPPVAPAAPPPTRSVESEHSGSGSSDRHAYGDD